MVNIAAEMKVKANSPFSCPGEGGEMPELDVQIITSGGLRIPAHSSVLV